MKKVLRNSLIIVGLLLTVLIIFIGSKAWQIKQDFKHMAPLPSGMVAPDIYAINDKFVNLYILVTGGQLIAIDAGTGSEQIARDMKKLNLDPANVSVVLLTHTDSDHTGGLGLFRNANVYLSSQEEQMINGKTIRMITMHNTLKVPYQMLADGQKLEIGGISVQGVLSPGHTPGSMSYLVNGKYLFTGDSLGLSQGKVTSFAKSFNMDTPLQMRSIKKLSVLPGVEYLLTAHHGMTAKAKEAFTGIK